MRRFLLSVLIAGCALFLMEACSQTHNGKPEAVKEAAAIYHFHPQNYPPGSTSKNIEVQDVDEGWSIKALEGATVASTMSLEGGQTAIFPDGLGSTNIHVVVNPKTGYTGLAGLRFQDNAILNIWTDGTVEVDKEGVRASDESGKKKYVSKKMRMRDKSTRVMVERFE